MNKKILKTGLIFLTALSLNGAFTSMGTNVLASTNDDSKQESKIINTVVSKENAAKMEDGLIYQKALSTNNKFKIRAVINDGGWNWKFGKSEAHTDKYMNDFGRGVAQFAVLVGSSFLVGKFGYTIATRFVSENSNLAGTQNVFSTIGAALAFSVPEFTSYYYVTSIYTDTDSQHLYVKTNVKAYKDPQMRQLIANEDRITKHTL